MNSPANPASRRSRECSVRITLIGMTTISLKVPNILNMRLAKEARRRRTSKSAVIRECVEQMLLTPRKDQAVSCLDLARDLAGCLSGPRDITTNPKYLGDFGQ